MTASFQIHSKIRCLVINLPTASPNSSQRKTNHLNRTTVTNNVTWPSSRYDIIKFIQFWGGTLGAPFAIHLTSWRDVQWIFRTSICDRLISSAEVLRDWFQGSCDPRAETNGLDHHLAPLMTLWQMLDGNVVGGVGNRHTAVTAHRLQKVPGICFLYRNK
jgi:hypothetical protein